MATLHFFGSDKGGVGKSLVAKTAAQYHLDRGIDFALFDADRSTPDVKQAYENCGCRSVIFSESKEYENEPRPLYFEARKRTTLVNLPPHVGMALKGWFEKNDLFEIAEEEGVKLVYWFICSGEPTSVRLLGEHLRYFQGKIDHVLVKNLIHSDSWKYLDEDRFVQDKIAEYGVKVLDFPQFVGKNPLRKISEKRLTFGEAREYEEFHPLDRSQIKAVLSEAYQEFDNAEIFKKDINAQKEEVEI
ncbi:MAG: hypothetical protein AB4368_14200 [Xenococcaceae cyanobacterium]